MDALRPFCSDQQFLVTDAHGNELTVQNGTDEIAIFGTWQGRPSDPVVDGLHRMLLSIQPTPGSAASQGVSVRGHEIVVRADLTVIRGHHSLELDGLTRALARHIHAAS